MAVSTEPQPTRGEWALVTGAGRRIGAALATAAADAGFDVLIHYHKSRREAEALASALVGQGRKAIPIGADLADPDTPRTLATAAPGPLTLLVNSASEFIDDRVGAIDGQDFDRMLAVNLRAPVLLSQAFAAALDAGRQGLIVQLTDQRVWRPTPQYFSYSLSKSALWAATKTLAQALAPRIRVNAIGPGPTLPSIHQAPGEFESEAAAVPLGHGPQVEELGAALRYLIDAPSVTGQMIAVDGGQHLAWRTPDVLFD